MRRKHCGDVSLRGGLLEKSLDCHSVSFFSLAERKKRKVVLDYGRRMSVAGSPDPKNLRDSPGCSDAPSELEGY